MKNPQIGKDGILRDGNGGILGKVNSDNSVVEVDGWKSKGQISPEGKYIDEFGTDRGWAGTDLSSVSGGSAGLGCLGIAAALGISIAVTQQLTQLDKEKKISLWSSNSLLFLVLAFLLMFFTYGKNPIPLMISGIGLISGVLGIGRSQNGTGKNLATIGIIGNIILVGICILVLLA